MTTTTINPNYPPMPKRNRSAAWWMLGTFAIGLVLGSGIGYASQTDILPPAPVPAVAAPVAPAPIPEPVVAPAPVAAPVAPAKKVTDRELALIVKSPEKHTGESIVIYGYSMGDDFLINDSIRATISAKDDSGNYGYSTTWVNLAPAAGFDMSNVVQGDEFRAEVTVNGMTNNTPEFTVTSLTVTKEAK